MANLFGFQITRAPKERGEQPTFVLPEPETGATTTAGFYSEFLDIEGQTKNEYDLIRKYRSTAEHPECDLAIEDIINEAEDTLTILNNYVDGLEISADKEKVKTVMRSLYNEALSIT